VVQVSRWKLLIFLPLSLSNYFEKYLPQFLNLVFTNHEHKYKLKHCFKENCNLISLRNDISRSFQGDSYYCFLKPAQKTVK